MMRSYGTARGLFTFLSVCSWIMMGIGVAALFIATSAINELTGMRASFQIGLMSLLFYVPGIVIFLVGFVSLSLTQIGRAGVDTAEYTQQMLQLSRDQLNVSQQSLRQGEQIKQGFEALKENTAKMTSASFAVMPDRQMSPSPDAVKPDRPDVIAYKGKDIIALEHGARLAGLEFRTVDAAKIYVDDLEATALKPLASQT